MATASMATAVRIAGIKALVLAAWACCAVGCSCEHPVAGLDAGVAEDGASACVPTRPDVVFRLPTAVDDVDLLFMIDNSNSMQEEQASLTRELPRLVRILASGDLDGDGSREFRPVRSLHVGVVTSDMGVGGFTVPTCGGGTFGAMFGDDGVLLTRSGAGIAGCDATYPAAVFEFNSREAGVDPNAFARDVACVATTGTGGCGFEQQLEAVLKALSPSAPQSWTIPGYMPPIFFGGTFGHADGANAGFIRENSALAIILVSDEEDCSTPNPDIFNPMSATFGGTDLNLRCFRYPEVVYPIERYVRGEGGTSGLLGLRSEPDLLVFAAIVGVPTDAVPDPRNVDYDAILMHPAMQEMIDPTMPTRLRPSCNDPDRGIAFPPRRIVHVAQELERAGASATVQSICQESYAGALDAILEKIARALRGACLPEDLDVDAAGRVDCRLIEVLPATGPTTSCEGLPGRMPAGRIEVAGVVRNVCEVTQVGPTGAGAGEAGWFYETAETGNPRVVAQCGPSGQRIGFANAQPVAGASMRLECDRDAADVTLGVPCDPASPTGEANPCTRGRAPSGDPALVPSCDAAIRVCGMPCTTDADCTAAGLLGEACDLRPWREVVGGDARRIMQLQSIGIDVDAPHGFCVSPSCL